MDAPDYASSGAILSCISSTSEDFFSTPPANRTLAVNTPYSRHEYRVGIVASALQCDKKDQPVRLSNATDKSLVVTRLSAASLTRNH